MREQSKRLNLHITGDNFKTAIEQMDEFETEQKKNLRQKYSRSNQDIFARLHRPIDKVFSASGGSVVINLPERSQKEFNIFLQSIRKGMSLRKWVQQIALPAYQIDPNGLVFIEIDEDGNPYPTYKSTQDIFYYKLKGREVEMVIFSLDYTQVDRYALGANNYSSIVAELDKNRKKSRYYRVVDAFTDKVVEWDGKEVREIAELNLPNPFMRCPAMIVSDIFKFNSDIFLSPDSQVVELANSILTQNSVFEIWKNLHMFPKYWRVQSVCPTCQGHKVVNGVTCTSCDGTGFQKQSRVRDELLIPIPDSQDGKISIPTQFDGYSTPPVEAWDLSTSDLDRLYAQMYETLWGYPPKEQAAVRVNSQDKTATQVMEEGNAKVQRLYSYSEWAESIEKFIIDLCAELLYGQAYKGCSVNYGDRYIMESPDRIWEKYSDARLKGAAQAVLDDLLRDYYEARYFGNPMALQKALKQMRVEPWVHLTLIQVQSLEIVEVDKMCKMYFSEWSSTLKDVDWVISTDDELRAKMIEYCTAKYNLYELQEPEEQDEKKGAIAA